MNSLAYFEAKAEWSPQIPDAFCHFNIHKNDFMNPVAILKSVSEETTLQVLQVKPEQDCHKNSAYCVTLCCRATLENSRYKVSYKMP